MESKFPFVTCDNTKLSVLWVALLCSLKKSSHELVLRQALKSVPHCLPSAFQVYVV